MNFDLAFERLIGHEGGYTNHPKDPGGETKYGISKRSYPAEDIATLTLARAKEIYRRDFWTASGCDSLPEHIRFDLFDMAVNSGVTRAIKTLQQAAGTAADGVIGPKTQTAVRAVSPWQLTARFNARRLAFMASLPNWPTFSRGWALRIADNLLREYE